MRADRLVQLLLFLQRRPTVTAAEVAVELEISERTARRDLEALAMSGVPVYSSPGRGGGWRLIGGATTDLSGFTEAETRALFLLAAGAMGVDPTLRAALHKVIQAVPETFRPFAQVATSSVIVDPEGWGGTSQGPARPGHLDTVTAAVFGCRVLNLGYTNTAGLKSQRRVNPLGVVEKRGSWYLVATRHRSGPLSDRRSGEPRAYRIDRITAAVVSDDLADRPDGFDLAETWRSINESFAENTMAVTAWAWARPSWRYDRLRAIAGRRLIEHELDGEGRVRIELTGWTVDSLVGDLAALGATVEVESPPELMDKLASVGGELVNLYGSRVDGPG